MRNLSLLSRVALRLLVLGAVWLLSPFHTIAGGQPRPTAVYERELIRLKRAATRQLQQHVAAFNTYPKRPQSDGPFNASNNYEFLRQTIPLFSSSDTLLTKVYNYRWWMISKHLKPYDDPQDAKRYWVITEFFGPRPWASRSGAITCPAGHQFYDVRWLRDDKFVKSYAEYWMRGSAAHLPQRENANFLTYLSRPESHHFSSWMINGVEAMLKVHPDKPWLHTMLPYLEHHQQVWDSLFTVKTPGAKTNGMYKILDLYDGMEFSLSALLGLLASANAYSLYTPETWRQYYLGWETTANAAQSTQAHQYPMAFRKGYPDFYLVRPSVNSYAYGNLQALANLYTVDKAAHPLERTQDAKITLYQQRAAKLQQQVLDVLWQPADQFFETVSAGDNAYGIGDYVARVRESVGYTPWYFKLIPPQHYMSYSPAWALFSSPRGFYGTVGMTTAEQQHPYFNEQAYAWNGRGWPFENSVVYKAYATYLRSYKQTPTPAEKQLLYAHIDQLVRLHGANQPNIGEWYIPSTGQSFGGESDYFHSTFPDIIIEDLLGFSASLTNTVTITPLLTDTQWDQFYLGNLRYHGHDIDLVWKRDWNPTKPGQQSRLCVWVDHKLVAHSPTLGQSLTIRLPN